MCSSFEFESISIFTDIVPSIVHIHRGNRADLIAAAYLFTLKKQTGRTGSSGIEMMTVNQFRFLLTSEVDNNPSNPPIHML